MTDTNDTAAAPGTEISVVLCTRDRGFRLSRTLAAIERLSFDRPWELVLVDNGSRDETPEVLRAFAQATKLKVVLTHEPEPGLSNARNRGWRAASGAIVAFTDDDCYPAEDWLEKISLCLADEQLAYVGGRVLLYDKEDLAVAIQLLDERVDIPARSFVRVGLIHGANVALRRSVLEAIGGFDPLLGAGSRLKSGEDVDALMRASAAGYRGAYDPGPVVDHHHGRKELAAYHDLKAGYDQGRGAVLLKGLLDPRVRLPYSFAVIRRLGGHVVFRRFRAFRSEVRGAMLYLEERRKRRDLRGQRAR
jgi:hypothetical protein